jgi:hypothetical protein
MSKEKIKPVEINDGHYVEMLDRLHTVNIMIDELLYDHPVPHNHPEVSALVQKAQDTIIAAYQLVGGIDAQRHLSPTVKALNYLNKKQEEILRNLKKSE